MTDEHHAMFARLRIHRNLLADAGVCSVSDAQARDPWQFGQSQTSDLSGIVFPYLDPETGRRVTARLRRDHPEIDATGKTQRKYISPGRDNRHLYFPPGVANLLTEASVPVVFVEAEKSCLALTALADRAERRILPVATGGCWGWRGKVGVGVDPRGNRKEVRGPLPDLDRIALPGRTAIILFDANVTTNLDVQAARRRLAQELESRGASVRIVDIPQVEGVNGPDDLLCVSGDEAMWVVFDSARPFAEMAEREAEASIAALGKDKKHDPIETIESIAAIPNPLRRTLLMGNLCALKIPGLTKDSVKQAVEAIRNELRAKQGNAEERTRVERLLRLGVNPGQLITDLEDYYSRRRIVPKDTALVEALFAMNTHTFELFDTTSYLLYDSATSGCGKTTALERHEPVCARAYFGVDPSAAALYRRIDRDKPTWLLDEARTIHPNRERGAELFALFDAGYKRGATVSRCEDHGEGIRDFAVFCPKVLARIGSFRGTLLDRGIVIHLEKARGLRQRRRNVRMKEAAPLKEKLEAYALQYQEKLRRLYEDQPDEGYWAQISGREEEVWGPLLIHARLAGPEIERRAVEVALQFSRQKAKIAIAEDRVLALAREALEILRSLDCTVFFPKDLVQSLQEKETWGEHLADRKSDKARVTAIGTFFNQFQPASRHTEAGTEYPRLEVIAALERHVPETSETRIEGVKVSEATPSISKLDGYAADTPGGESSVEVSVAQSYEREDVMARPDTLTPQSAVKTPVIKELF